MIQIDEIINYSRTCRLSERSSGLSEGSVILLRSNNRRFTVLVFQV